MSILMVKEPATWLTNDRVDWQRVDELLKVAQYEQAAELLRQAEIENEQMGETALAGMLAATLQICLALAASQTEMESYQRAYTAAHERQDALIGQLHVILSSVGNKSVGAGGHELVTLFTQLTTPFDLPGHEMLEAVVRRHSVKGLQELLGGQLNALPPVFAELKVELPTAPSIKAAQRGNACGLVVSCLGPFRVYQNERLVDKWNGYKCKLLFKYLVIHRQRPTHREILMDLFWPEADAIAARKNLHQAIFNLRQTLQAGCPDFNHILLEDSCYYLNPELEVDLDSEAFMRHYQNGQQLERQDYLSQAIKEYELADTLYKGEFLAEDLYEDWTTIQRENLQYIQLDILNRLSQIYIDQKQYVLCMAFCQKILALDNCHEEAHCRLMRCYQSQGQRHLALRQYHLCADAMERELGVRPTPSTVELYRQIQGNHVEFPR